MACLTLRISKLSRLWRYGLETLNRYSSTDVLSHTNIFRVWTVQIFFVEKLEKILISVLFYDLTKFHKIEIWDSSFIALYICIFFSCKPNCSIFKTVPTLEDSRTHWFLTELGMNWRLSDLIYGWPIRTRKSPLARVCEFDKGRSMQIWWRYLLSFFSHPKISGAGRFAPSQRAAG